MGAFRLVGVVIAVVIAGFVWQDANKRGMSGPLWGIGTFLVCIIFLPLYLIMRKPIVVAGVPMPSGTPVYMPPPPPGQYPGAQPPQQYYPQAPPPPQYPAPPGTTPHPAATGPVHFCTQCGQKYEGTVKFCPNCGAAV